MLTSKINIVSTYSLDKKELRQKIFNWIQFSIRVVPYKAKLLHSRAYAFLYLHLHYFKQYFPSFHLHKTESEIVVCGYATSTYKLAI